MCILPIDELRVIQESRLYPGKVEHQIRQAEAIIKQAERTGELKACIGGAGRLVRLTVALWDYFRDRECLG